MKVKLDENLPLQIAVELRARLHDVQTVWEEGLSGHADLDIWEGAQREGRVLITQDLDFSDARKFVPGTHHGIVLIRLRSPSRRNLIARVPGSPSPVRDCSDFAITTYVRRLFATCQAPSCPVGFGPKICIRNANRRTIGTRKH